MKRLAFCFLIVSCAALRAQWRYEGAEGMEPFYTGIRHEGRQAVADVVNPTPMRVSVTLTCDFTEWASVSIPPRMGQTYLLDPRDTKCALVGFHFEGLH